jgi:hypothetical protein
MEKKDGANVDDYLDQAIEAGDAIPVGIPENLQFMNAET